MSASTPESAAADLDASLQPQSSPGRSPAGSASTAKARRLLFLTAAFLPLILLLAWQAWRTYWQCDDAFISYRYVRNFVEGYGLVFNRGERVEGYTNFLWVLELSGLWKFFGLRPEIGCNVLSGLYTAGSLALTVALALRGPFPDRRIFVAWGALLLLGVSHTWAVWSTSGLETRQFTFFVLLSILCLSGYPRARGRLLLASLSLAACEYTRPEGTLIFGCCVAWLIVDSLMHDRFKLRDVLSLSVPFVLVVGLHYAWRWHYYGDLWPNTYYAKHVRSWPEAGFTYMALAACEFGMYVVVPAALLGTVARLHRGDWTHLLSLLCLGSHAAYVIRIGGDHFEFRVLDFYWPLLAVAAVEGVVALSMPLRKLSVWRSAEIPWLGADAAAVVLLGVVVVYACAVEVAKDLVTSALTTRDQTVKMKTQIRSEEFPAVFLLPGMPAVIEEYNSLYAFCSLHGVASPQVEHSIFWREGVHLWSPYEALHGTGLIPPDAVTNSSTIGTFGYYLADVTVIDSKGLTDRHVARLPVPKSNKDRYMAHDRQVDWAYLVSRGFNMRVKSPSPSAEAALARANYALRVRDGLWMPFESTESDWVERSFQNGQDVRTWRVRECLGCFAEGDLSAWTVQGKAFEDQPRKEERHRSISNPIRRCSGLMRIDTRPREKGEPATGRALSPRFRVPPDGRLEFWFGGTKDADVGMRLLENGTVVHEWRPKGADPFVPEHLDLKSWEGKDLQLFVFDDSDEEGGFILLADIVVLVPGSLNGI